MALFLEKTIYNGDVVRYHRIVSFTVDPVGRIATVKLGSFRDLDHRSLPVPPTNTLDFTFQWSGDTNTLSSEAYTFIKSQPEWRKAADV